jgi:cytochrome c oxidase subunit 2
VQHKFWSLVFGVVIFCAFMLFVVAAIVPGWWLPRQVSTFGGEVDGLFYLILAITGFFFLLTEAILIYNIWKAADADPNKKAPFVHGNHQLEWIWTIVPAGILILIGVLQISAWEHIKYLKNFPKADSKVQQMVVVARQWEWRIRYPSPDDLRAWEQEGDKAKGPENWARLAEYPYEDQPQFDDIHAVNEIHCYCQNDKESRAPVLVHLKTRDVLHSFFLPQLRLKQDAVPGKVIPVWFEVKKDEYNVEKDPASGLWVQRKDAAGSNVPYDWDLACAEFCGTRHSMMRGHLFVHKDRADFLDWLRHQKKDQDQRQAPKTVAAR